MTAFLIAILTLLAHNAQSVKTRRFRDYRDFRTTVVDTYSRQSLADSASECSQINFDTDDNNLWGFKAGYGFYFDVYTLAEIEIKGIGVHAKKLHHNTTIEVWKRQGSGSYLNETGGLYEDWEMIQSSSIEGMGLASITDLEFPADTAITVAAGAKQAFRIVSDYQVLMGLPYDQRRHHVGKEDGILHLLAGDITFTEGSLIEIPEDQVPVLWNGRLNYCQLGDPIEAPSSRYTTDEECSSITLSTTESFWGEEPVYGNYFDVLALIDMKIVGFSVHASSNIGQISIYSTKEGSFESVTSDEAQWDLLHTQSNVEVDGSDQLTDLNMLGSPLELANGEKRGFLIISTSPDLISKSFTPAGVAYRFDQYTRMFNGPRAKTGEAFEESADSFAFQGGIKYCLNVDDIVIE